MNSSNSFNICPRCGNSNSLNAKYCSRCGAQLKVPQEAVVCPKCHTRNSSLANFCRNCGATLKIGAQTKICPRCGKELNAEENVCACGYSFVTLQQTEPRPVNVASTNKSKKDKKRDKRQQQQAALEQQAEQQVGKTKTTYSKKGGRGFAIFATLLLAVFCYFIIAPATARGILPQYDKGFYYGPQSLWDNPATPEKGGESSSAKQEQGDILFAEPDDTTGDTTDPSGTGEQTPTEPDTGSETGGTTGDNTGAGDNTGTGDNTGAGDGTGNDNNTTNPPAETDGEIHYVYGFSCIKDIIDFGKNFKTLQDQEGGAFAYLIENVGTAGFIILILVALFIITAAFHAVVCIVRIFTQHRSKRMNVLYLVLAIVTTLLVVLMVCSQLLPQTEGFLATVKAFFAPMNGQAGAHYGNALFLIPIYYWVFWLYSCLAKAKKVKKEA